MGNFVYFSIINKWLSDQIYGLQGGLLSRMSELISGVALLVMTLWITYHGYRIITGQTQAPMMGLVVDALRNALIVIVAVSMAAAGNQLYWNLTDGIATDIIEVVTGHSEGPFQQIDDNLAGMQLAMTTIDTIMDGGNGNIASDLTRDKWMSGVGIAGPAVIGGSLLLLNRIALALFIGLGPLFILCLLFRQTAPLFQRWLLYGIGTVFSLGMLSLMVSIAMKMLTAVTASYVGSYLASMAASGLTNGAISSSATDGLNSLALQQGGIGLILTTLLISAPPMAANFFQGTLGQTQFFSPFGRIGEGPASAVHQNALFHKQQAQLPIHSPNSQGTGPRAGNIPQMIGSSGYQDPAARDLVKPSSPN